ncbi:MAG: hypothetical protein HY900_31765 [Deltaproteobacteria bacterium]|nr:hypothetical protein [Deltaproteobacteria bacterium]
MRRTVGIPLALVGVLALVGLSLAGARGKMELRPGDEVYACNCGEKCPCDSLSRNPGTCTCGKEMVKATAVSTGEGNVMLKAAGWEKERSFKVAGKYVCACPPSCTCDTQSQNPGKCTCGKDMKPAEM